MIEAVTYNTEYGKRLPEICDWLSGLAKRPDLVCFQEFPETSVNQLSKLGYDYRFAPAIVKHGRLYGELTAFDHARLSLIKSKRIDLGEDILERVYRKGSPSQRSALVATFRTNEGTVVITNVHLAAIALHSRRREQLTMIIKELGEDPSIILGDFNYTDLVGGNGLSVFMGGHGFDQAGGKLNTHNLGATPHQLDYVFSKGCSVTEVRVEDIPYSDHLPVFAKITLP